MKGMLLLLASAALLASPGAQAQEEAVFRPAGNWIADYGDDYCRLARTFSDGQREMSLALERLQPGAFVRLIIVGEGLRPFRSADQIAYAFQPSGASGKARYVRSETPDRQPFVSFDPVTLAPLEFTPGTPPPMYDRAKELETARGITGFLLTEGLTSPVKVETGSLRAPVEALQACADDLLTVWGLDAEKHKTMTAMVVLNPNPQGVLPQGTIPFGEFEKFAGGANQVRLLIGADGKVTDCAIYTPTLSQSLNDRICRLAKERATFVPAKDAGGQAMASVWMGSPMFLGPPFGGARRAGGPAVAQAVPQQPVPISDLPEQPRPAVPDNFGAGTGTTPPATPAPATPPANP